MKKTYFEPQVVMIEVTPATTLCVSIITETPAPEGTHASAPRRVAAGHGI